MSDAPTIDALRKAISEAEAEGFATGDMLLKVNRRDLALIKRSPTVAVEEVSFSGGEMRFLGVKVSAVCVDNSHLDRTGVEDVVPEPVVKPKKAPVRKKKVVAAA